MFNASETIAILVGLLGLLLLLIWGYNRAKGLGKLGILAWLQSVVLLVPGLVFFALLMAGINLNLLAILALLLAGIGVYIYLGNLLRSLGYQPAKSKPIIVEEKPVLTAFSPIPPEDLAQIKSIFGIDTFFATETISYQEGAIFKGNLRADPEYVYKHISAKLQNLFQDKYRLFLVESPEGKPVFITLPSSRDPVKATLAEKNLAIVLIVATIFTNLEAASMLLGFDWFTQLGRYSEALPLALGLMSILLAHEIGHLLVARHYQINLSIPFFLPTWQLGSFGAITRFESILPNRSTLFDISLAGPVLGGLVSLIILITGLFYSNAESILQIPSQFFRSSLLVGTLAHLFLGDALKNSLVTINPLTILGWLGLIITALNLLPVGQLDGGRIILAIYGRKIARWSSLTTIVILGLVALINLDNPIPLYWAVLIIFLQRELERPSLNEITELDDPRAITGLVVFFFMLAVLIPFSPSLAQRLGF